MRKVEMKIEMRLIMKFESIKKVLTGKFIHRYDITYRVSDGSQKVYEMISRNPNIQTHEELQGKKRAEHISKIMKLDFDMFLSPEEIDKIIDCIASDSICILYLKKMR